MFCGWPIYLALPFCWTKFPRKIEIWNEVSEIFSEICSEIRPEIRPAGRKILKPNFTRFCHRRFQISNRIPNQISPKISQTHFRWPRLGSPNILAASILNIWTWVSNLAGRVACTFWMYAATLAASLWLQHRADQDWLRIRSFCSLCDLFDRKESAAAAKRWEKGQGCDHPRLAEDSKPWPLPGEFPRFLTDPQKESK